MWYRIHCTECGLQYTLRQLQLQPIYNYLVCKCGNDSFVIQRVKEDGDI